MKLKWEHCGCYGREKDFILNSVLDETWSYLFGYFIGDGYIAKSGTYIRWLVENSQVTYMKHLLESKFEQPFSCYANGLGKSSVKDLCLSGTAVVNFLLSLGFKHGAANKVIPSFLLHSPAEGVVNDYITPSMTQALLQGLFDSDGGISRVKPPKRSPNRLGCEIYFSSTSEILAKQVKSLILPLGMDPSLHLSRKSLKDSHHHDEWRFSIANRDGNLTFYQCLGFRLKCKQDILEDFLLEAGQITRNIGVN